MTATVSDRRPVPSLSRSDIWAALNAGIGDFKRAPLFGLFFGAVFSVIGIVVSWLLVVHASSYWVLPIAAGFPLVGPFAAVGLYEVSRRLEHNEPLSWGGVLSVIIRQSRLQLSSYAFVALFVYLIWVYLAHLIFALSFGLKPLTNVMSSADLLLTTEGLTMLVAGIVVGGVLAAILFAVSVTAVPMLLAQDVDIVTAMITSVQTVMRNTGVMIIWAVLLAVLIALAMVPLFLGMVIVFPVLGHASWHLYRRAASTGPALERA